jgi:CRP/FNR family transcriptional regulator, anaerobic regulatory protein
MQCPECPLRSSSICHVFGRDDLAELEAARVRQVSLPAKRVIMREGETPNEVYRVQGGWGVRFKMLANGSRQILSFVLPGDFLTLELLHDGPMPVSLLTLTRVTLCAFSREQIARDAYANLRRVHAISQLWRRRVHDLERNIVLLGRMPAAGRIAGLVLDIHAQLTRRGMTAGNDFPFPLRHEDLADALGLTPAHVSRTLTALRQDRLLEIRSARAAILDRDGLQKLAT